MRVYYMKYEASDVCDELRPTNTMGNGVGLGAPIVKSGENPASVLRMVVVS
jgi:hypothetical protein